MSFYSEDKEVPKELIFENYKLRQLKATDNELDYVAVLESGFRPEGFPKEENLEQIVRHEKAHDLKEEFAKGFAGDADIYNKEINLLADGFVPAIKYSCFLFVRILFGMFLALGLSGWLARRPV